MTNDFDDLLSAYIDGQATPEEVALVESDPALVAEAEAMAVVVDRLAAELPTPPPGLRQAQIASALSTFDELTFGADEAPATSEGSEGGAIVSDLGAHRADRQRAARQRPRTSGRPNGLPAWLGAAAAVLVAVGGIGWVVRAGGSDDSADTASMAADDTTAADSAESAALATDDATRDQADVASGGEDSVRTEAETALSEPAEDAADEASDGAAPADSSAAPTTTAAKGFFPEEANEARDGARLSLTTVPTKAELEDLAAGPLLDPALSLCGSLIEAEPGRSLIGMVPISVGERQGAVEGEVLVYAAEDGSGPFPVAVSTELIDGVPGCGPLE